MMLCYVFISLLVLCFLHCISALQCSWNTMEPVFEFLRFFRWTFWLWEISLFAQSRGLEKSTFRIVCVWHVSPSMDTFENLWPHLCVKRMCAKTTSVWRILQKFSGFCIGSFSWSSVNVPNCENPRGPIHFVAQEKEEFLNSYNLLHKICLDLREILG